MHKFFSMYLFIYSSLHVSSMSCSSSGETDCINTASGGSKPAHDTATNTEWQLPEAVLIQFVSPDDEHDMLETCRELQINKYYEKNLCVKLDNYQEAFPESQKSNQVHILTLCNLKAHLNIINTLMLSNSNRSLSFTLRLYVLTRPSHIHPYLANAPSNSIRLPVISLIIFITIVDLPLYT